MADRPVYKKHNSFVSLKHKQDTADRALYARIALIAKASQTELGMSSAHFEILQRALLDVLNQDRKNLNPKFSLTPSVIQELLSYPDDSVFPRYLVHRYRYEMFPKFQLLDDFPPYLQIEPSSICNYRCIFCFETDKTFTQKSSGFMGHMSLDTFRSIIDQAEGHVEFISLASRGEPLLCPEIVPMLKYTAGKFLNLKLNTNASMLDEEKCHAILAGGVKTLVFSADAATESLYEKLRVNGKLDRVLTNIERFQKIRELHYPDSRIITRVSGVKISDDQQIVDMERVWGGLVDQVAFVSYNPWENTYEQESNGIKTPCSDLWRRMFVWWDGKVNPCDVDYKSRLSVGFTGDGLELSKLWRSSKYEHLRERHCNKGRHEFEPCSRCTVT